MLQRLAIQNYLLIENVTLDFSEGVNIITGETGAGKSILIGALSLILGERADAKVLLNQEKKCVIEATFAIDTKLYAPLFETNEIDIEHYTILRREINNSGKSRAFINDTPVNLSTLKLFANHWINLHNQHQTLELVNEGFQLNFLDEIAHITEKTKAYTAQHKQYKSLKKQIEQLLFAESENKKQFDFLQFQLEELSTANLQAGEQNLIEEEQKILANAEEIKQQLLSAKFGIEENEVSVLSLLTDVLANLKSGSLFSSEINNLREKLSLLREDIKDIYRELDRIESHTEINPERLTIIDERLNLIYKLQKKHSVNSIEELLSIQTTLEETLQQFSANTEQINKLNKEATLQFAALQTTAEELHIKRLSATTATANAITLLLHEMGMPNATFSIMVEKSETHTDKGFSEVQFLFSANKGFALQAIKNVASGGELSRLMLAIKAVLAKSVALPTLIFDEIDNGISGEVAYKVGDIMQGMSGGHQLICITHLPQISRTADTHFYIYKTLENEKTKTNIKILTQTEQINEMAKMLSGNTISEAAISNAKALLKI